jgi:hypothetical protein
MKDGKMSKSTVWVDKNYLSSLEADSRKLAALEAGGVDNWEWYGQALEDAGLLDEDEDE